MRQQPDQSKWFVMLNQGNETPAPLVDDTDNVKLFDSSSDAESAARENPLGKAFGYDVYEWSLV